MNVRLVGGPMDRWLVKPEAPVLRPGWAMPRPPRRSLVDVILRRPGHPTAGRAGRYVLDADGLTARWSED